MNSLPKTHNYHHLSFTHRHSSLQTSFSTFSFASLPSYQFYSSPLLLPSIKASSSSQKNNNNPFQKPQNAFSQLLRTLNPIYSPLFEPAYVATTVIFEKNVRARKLSQSIRAADRLIELEPEDLALILLKSHLHSYNGEHKLAEKGFELTLQQDPLNFRAYRGLLMAISNLEESMEGFLKKVDGKIRFMVLVPLFAV